MPKSKSKPRRNPRYELDKAEQEVADVATGADADTPTAADAADGIGGSVDATATIAAMDVDDGPAAAANGSATTAENATVPDAQRKTASGRPQRRAVVAAETRAVAQAAAEAAAKAAAKAPAGGKRRGRPAGKTAAKTAADKAAAGKVTGTKRPRAESAADAALGGGASGSGTSGEEEDDFVTAGAAAPAAKANGKGKAPKEKKPAPPKAPAGKGKAAAAKKPDDKEDDSGKKEEKRGPPAPETILNCSWQFGLPVNEKPNVTKDNSQLVDTNIKDFFGKFREAQITEKVRYDEAGGQHPNGKKMSKRPDLVALSNMRVGGKFINKGVYFGHVPGIPVNKRFYSRAEAVTVGLHCVHMKGIDYVSGADVKKFLVGNRKTFKLGPAREDSIPEGMEDPGNDDLGSIGLSVVVSGCYGDDKDDKDHIEYTGEGGNDYLGNKKQIGNQSLSRGNQALVNNQKYGLPVRVLRKNEDEHAFFSVSYIYDGLYDVRRCWSEQGKDGYLVWKFDLHRRPHQPESLARQVHFGSAKNAPPKMDPRTRPGIVFTDYSRGKENIIVPVVNEADPSDPHYTNLPPGIDPVADKDSDLFVDKKRAFKKHPTDFEYVTEYIFGEGVPRPEPACVPEDLRGQEPHTILEKINHGLLPYQGIEERGKNTTAKKKKKEVSILSECRSLIWECGDWTGCKLGDSCPQRAVQKGIQYRLEVFHTGDRGFGVRTWDFIPESAFVCAFWGELNHAKHTVEDTYLFACAKRPDMDYLGKDLPPIEKMNNLQSTAKFQVDAKCKGNVSRFINHSCNPNTFAQPVCVNTLDESYCIVCFFAFGNIDPWTELTYDYGRMYVEINLEGKCGCGAPDCRYERLEGGASNLLRHWAPHKVMERKKQKTAKAKAEATASDEEVAEEVGVATVEEQHEQADVASANLAIAVKRASSDGMAEAVAGDATDGSEPEGPTKEARGEGEEEGNEEEDDEEEVQEDGK